MSNLFDAKKDLNPTRKDLNPTKKEAKNEKLAPNVANANRNNSKKYAMNPSIQAVSSTSILEKRNNVLFGQPDIATVVKETGEIIGKPINIMAKTIDTNNFLKVFMDGWRPIIKELPPLMAILLYVGETLKFGEDEVRFNMQKCMEYTGLCQSTIQRHINKMLALGIIYETRQRGDYFISAEKFWKGNRVKYIQKANIITQNVDFPKETKRTIKPFKSGKIIKIDNGKAKEQGV